MIGSTSHRALDDAIHAIPVGWFQPSRTIYWIDLLSAAAVGWASFVPAVRGRGWSRAGFFFLSTCALYRAVLFIHEITHRGPRDVPAFVATWNVLVGIPLLLPSFLYEGVHLDHHRARSYGTPSDPEYVPFGRRSPWMMVALILGSLAAPIALAFRFGVLAPIGWLVPPVRRAVTQSASSLVINHAYVRRIAIGPAGRLEEAAACAVVWMSAWLYATGVWPPAVYGCWLVASSTAFGVNAIRTLAAHRYDRDDGELSMTDQLLDSCTIQRSDGLLPRVAARLADGARALVAPVGLRYHALHHWIPALPYHRLGRTHRLLVATLRRDAPYLATLERGFTPVLGDLVQRSAERSGRARARRTRSSRAPTP